MGINAFRTPYSQRAFLKEKKQVRRLRTLVYSVKTSDEVPCTSSNVVPELVTAETLRSAILTDAKGGSIRLGDKMGKGTSIVVFLRHLG